VLNNGPGQARATWKGFLKISLVTIPIRVFPATESSKALSFNQLHGECQTRIQQRKWCPHCERQVPNSEVTKGYQFEKDRYVLLSDDDIAGVRPPSTRVIDLVQFADARELDPMHVDRTYYLAPDGATGVQAFAVMREGLVGKVGIGKLALYGREYLVAVRPRGRALVLHTLHDAAEMRRIDAVDELNAVPVDVDAAQVKLARQVITAFDAPLDLANYRDEYRAQLQRIIDAKVAGDEIVGPVAEPAPAPVNLLDALKRSLQAVSAAKKKPARVAAAGPTRKRA
jgi:DNA end-binding protein Ku